MVKKLELTEIGSLTTVSIPPYGIKKVPAKVDTGADISSIWASNITEKNGQLVFTLFDTRSPYYTGDKISLNHYSIRSVRNSFGKSELRYKVTIPVEVEGKQIKVTFTLANRSNNRFPILIGKRTLQNKFIVNVAKTPRRRSTKILVLTRTEKKNIPKFFANIEQNTDRQLRFTTKTYNDLTVKVSKNRVQILTDEGVDLSRYDMIYLISVGENGALAATVAQYAKAHDIKFLDEAHSGTPPSDKLHQYAILSLNKLSVPKTIRVAKSNISQEYNEIKDFIGVPFIYKDSKGNKGRNNFLIKNRKDFDAAHQAASAQKLTMIGQQFIANESDYRLLVLGANVELIIERKAQTGTHLNNTSVGGKADIVAVTKLPAKVQADAIKAAQVLKWNVAGVDMVKDKVSGTWYCLEVNNSPQIATGTFVADKETVFTDFLQRAVKVHFKED